MIRAALGLAVAAIFRHEGEGELLTADRRVSTVGRGQG